MHSVYYSYSVTEVSILEKKLERFWNNTKTILSGQETLASQDLHCLVCLHNWLIMHVLWIVPENLNMPAIFDLKQLASKPPEED